MQDSTRACRLHTHRLCCKGFYVEAVLGSRGFGIARFTERFHTTGMTQAGVDKQLELECAEFEGDLRRGGIEASIGIVFDHPNVAAICGVAVLPCKLHAVHGLRVWVPGADGVDVVLHEAGETVTVEWAEARAAQTWTPLAECMDGQRVEHVYAIATPALLARQGVHAPTIFQTWRLDMFMPASGGASRSRLPEATSVLRGAVAWVSEEAMRPVPGEGVWLRSAGSAADVVDKRGVPLPGDAVVSQLREGWRSAWSLRLHAAPERGVGRCDRPGVRPQERLDGGFKAANILLESLARAHCVITCGGTRQACRTHLRRGLSGRGARVLALLLDPDNVSAELHAEAEQAYAVRFCLFRS